MLFRSEKMIKAEGTTDGIKVFGYIGRSDNVRKNRNLENVFINGRYVKSLTAQAAIEKAYTSYIASDCFPACAIFIEMNPAIVDVNVHPAKLEVKFSDERRVFEAVYYTLKCALEESEYRPEMTLGAKKTSYNPINAFVPIGADTKGEQISFSHSPSYTANYKDEKSDMPKIASSQVRSSSMPSQENRERYESPISFKSMPEAHTEKKAAFSEGIKGEAMSPKASVDLLSRYSRIKEEAECNQAPSRIEVISLPSDQIKVPAAEYKYIGEAFDCYVMIEYEGAILIIDKHAAHERIIFEDLKRSRKEDGRVAVQQLMLPLTVLLTNDEIAVATEYKDDLYSVGFEFDINASSADLMGIPSSVSPSDAEGLFVKMLDDMAKGEGTPENSENIRAEQALYSIACKAAIKGGRNYDRSIIDWLIAKVLALPDITVCPHGRPIAYKLRKSELDRQFDRIK